MQFRKILCLGYKIVFSAQEAERQITELNKKPLQAGKYTEKSIKSWMLDVLDNYYPTERHFYSVDMKNMFILRGLYPNVRKIIIRRFIQEHYDLSIDVPTEILTLDEL